MLKNYFSDVDETTKKTLAIVNDKLVLENKEDIQRYDEYVHSEKYKSKDDEKSTDDNRTTTVVSGGDMQAGFEGKVVDNIFFKIDKAIQTGIKSINKFFIKTNVLLDDMEAYETVTPNITDLYKQRSELADLIKDNGLFSKIMNKKAPVLAGYNIKLKDGVEIVNRNIHIVKTLDTYMSDFEAMLDTFIDSKKDSVLLHINKDTLNSIEKNVNDVNNSLALTTNKKVIVDRQPVKKLVSNFIELNDVATELLKYGETLNMEMLEKFNERITLIITKLDIIQNAVQKDKIKMSKEELDDFVKYIGAMAKFTTAVSFLAYFYFQLINMTLGIIKLATTSKEDNTVINTIGAYIKKNYNIVKKFFSK